MASDGSLPARPSTGETKRTPSRSIIILAGFAIILAGWAAYSNSFDAAFSFDDGDNILHNTTIQKGWWAALQPPGGALAVSGRPLVNLSLELNYQLGGFKVWGYHALNLVVHLLAGLTLFGLVRRTLTRPALRAHYGAAALPLAFVIALLWTLHPLQTESVTNLIQRAEALMGLFYLLTMYCFVRGVESTRAWAWHALSVLACLLGMVTKESMVTAPLLVWLYDRAFVAATFAEAWRQRWKFYAALAATWLPLAWLVASVSWPGNASAINPAMNGLSPLRTSYVYALKQCEAVAHYLRLSFWPHPLVLDYGNGIVTNALEVAPQMVALALLLAGTLYALWKRPSLGFPGAWFFGILALTSSVVPLKGQTMAEHHMYLSLAAVMVFTVMPLYALLGRRAFAAGLALAVALGGLTYERNRDYRTELSIRTSIVQNNPGNSHGYRGLGDVFQASDRLREAVVFYETSLRMDPDDAETENSLGTTLYKLGQTEESIVHFLQAVKLAPDFAQAYFNLGNACFKTGQTDPARDAYIKAIVFAPNFARALNNLGSLYMVNFHQPDQAIAEFEAAIRADPTLFEAHASLANLYTKASRPADAIPHYEETIRLKPDFGEAQLGLGNALVLANRATEAIPHYDEAVRLMPDNPAAHGNYAAVLFQLERYAEAVRQFEETLRLDPHFPDASDNLAKARQLAAQSTLPQNSTKP